MHDGVAVADADAVDRAAAVFSRAHKPDGFLLEHAKTARDAKHCPPQWKVAFTAAIDGDDPHHSVLKQRGALRALLQHAAKLGKPDVPEMVHEDVNRVLVHLQRGGVKDETLQALKEAMFDGAGAVASAPLPPPPNRGFDSDPTCSYYKSVGCNGPPPRARPEEITPTQRKLLVKYTPLDVAKQKKELEELLVTFSAQLELTFRSYSAEPDTVGMTYTELLGLYDTGVSPFVS